MDRTDISLIALRRILRATELYGKELANAAKLTAAQFRALQIVGEIGHATPSDIATRMGVSQATITALVDKLAADGALDLGKIRRRSPMGRLVEPVELAEAAWFLASPAASAITGITLSVDCGWAAFGAAGDASAG